MSTLSASELSLSFRRRQRRGQAALCGFGALALLSFLLSLGWGAVAVTPGQVLAILGRPLGLDLPWSYGVREETVLLAIRLPRACLGVLSGAGLAMAGAALQGLFRNPLADPTLIGVSSGAAFGAVGMIVLGASLVAFVPAGVLPLLLPLAAFVGGLAVTALVYMIASRDGRTDVATLLLAGVAFNAMAGAGIGFMVFLSTDAQLRDLNFWLLGSLGGITWARMLPALPLILLAICVLPLFARHLDALLLGEGEALAIGFNVERAKRAIVVLAALGTGAAVAMTGIIGFIGLVVPHLVRLALGPQHRPLLPASLLLGASLMLLADLLARTLVLPAELPIGVLTALIGGPFFLWLLLRRRNRGTW